MDRVVMRIICKHDLVGSMTTVPKKISRALNPSTPHAAVTLTTNSKPHVTIHTLQIGTSGISRVLRSNEVAMKFDFVLTRMISRRLCKQSLK